MPRELPGHVRRARWQWLRDSLADPAAHGHELDTTDVNRLPEQHRARVRQVAAEARRLSDQGDRQLALEHARAGLRAIEADLAPSWRPPPIEVPTDDEIRRIRGEIV